MAIEAAHGREQPPAEVQADLLALLTAYSDRAKKGIGTPVAT
jgi:hypothetical protein